MASVKLRSERPSRSVLHSEKRTEVDLKCSPDWWSRNSEKPSVASRRGPPPGSKNTWLAAFLARLWTNSSAVGSLVLGASSEIKLQLRPSRYRTEQARRLYFCCFCDSTDPGAA